jgi:DNA-binding IclR family transcriptional regulator
VVREREYALDNEEFHLGNTCIAAPVKNYLGKTVAAISISLPKEQFALEQSRDALIAQVRSAALKISKESGYRFNHGEP